MRRAAIEGCNLAFLGLSRMIGGFVEKGMCCVYCARSVSEATSNGDMFVHCIFQTLFCAAMRCALLVTTATKPVPFGQREGLFASTAC